MPSSTAVRIAASVAFSSSALRWLLGLALLAPLADLHRLARRRQAELLGLIGSG
jgi:hypothetical protein